jgi:transcriptional activator HAC1
VLSRLLACSPAMARPLRDATGKALQLAVSTASLRQTGTDVVRGASWESLMTMAWAIDAASKRNSRTKRNSMRSYRRWDGDLSCNLSGKRDCKLME